MKYMTFNSSCSFAGVANMLAVYGVELEDRELALRMKLPYLFARDETGYLAGAMLQTAEWFDLGLRPLGFRLREEALDPADVAAYLRCRRTAMLGLRVTPRNKHAVVYTGCENGALYFLNNKRAQEEAPEQLLLTEAELRERIDAPCMVATLEPAAPQATDFAPLLHRSLEVLGQMHRELVDFCAAPHPTEEVFARMNPLFRPLLVDGIAMAGLLGETELQTRLTAVQTAFLTALRSGAEVLTLSELLPMETLQEAVADYASLIQKELKA
ncbi:MAG: hypothetical protein IJ357_00665 [Oscillospiraceae bacterium]|nr:hypothetical protein [Oscillospiraceae bacterium]